MNKQTKYGREIITIPLKFLECILYLCVLVRESKFKCYQKLVSKYRVKCLNRNGDYVAKTAHSFGVLIKSHVHHLLSSTDKVIECKIRWKSFENQNSVEFSGGYLKHQQWTLSNKFAVSLYSLPVPNNWKIFTLNVSASQNNCNVLMDFIHWNAVVDYDDDNDDDDNKRCICLCLTNSSIKCKLSCIVRWIKFPVILKYMKALLKWFVVWRLL